MMSINELYNEWLENTKELPYLHSELVNAQGNDDDLHDRFYKSLEFGTGGLRGIIGAGANRINLFTVAKATRGLAAYLNEGASPSCAIAYDSRNMSEQFAKTAARVLALEGIKVFIYPQLMPTPMLSFAVRHLKCSAGIVITASHNPAKYNGYKVYAADGCQITLNAANRVLAYIEAMPCFMPIPKSFEQLCESGEIEIIGSETQEAYYECVLNESLTGTKTALRVVYSPLYGAGNKPVRHILAKKGIEVSVVKEQENPNGDFPTCPYPNPEIAQAMRLAAEQMLAENADFCLATDPDCDRVGAAVKNIDGTVRLISGNEMGAMLLEYICLARTNNGTMPNSPIAVKTIVTTPLAQSIASAYGVEMLNVLTGFKYIGEQIGRLEARGEQARYIFGFEESYGYLSGAYVRDKDAVNAAMLICEMAAFYKEKGVSLLQALSNIYEKYGYCKSDLLTFEFPGESGMNKMNSLLDSIRQREFNVIKGAEVKAASDYLNDDTGLPKSNVISISFDDGSHIVVRPSGTEPKLKIYTTVFGKTENQAIERLQALNESCKLLAGC